MDRTWIYSECEKLSFHQSRGEFFNHLEFVADQLGFDRILYSALPYWYKADAGHAPFVAHTNFNPKWIEHYFEQRYDLYDTGLAHCLSGTDAPHIWPDNLSIEMMAPKKAQVLRDASAFNLRNGLTLPIHNVSGATGVLSLTFNGGKEDLLALLRQKEIEIQLFAYAFNELILRRETRFFGQGHNPLTVRELEVLQWLADGYTYDSIAEKLRIGLTTVKKHISSSLKKMNARNSIHACVLAHRWGYI